MIKRGEIYWVNLDPTVGSEIRKTRPGLVLSNEQNNEASQTITILPIISSTDRVYPFEVFLPASKSGLKEDCKIKANQIRTVDKIRLGKLMGAVNESVMVPVEEAVLLHLGIER